MQRRKFLALLVAAAAYPCAGRAQPATPLIGFVHSGTAALQERNVAAFRQALEDAGFADGPNARIEYRWADGQYERLPAQIAELVERKASVLAVFSPVAAEAARSVPDSVPVVFATSVDPAKSGLVRNLRQPGGSRTGVYIVFDNDLRTKQLAVLSELLPARSAIAALIYPGNADAADEARELQGVARAVGRRLVVLKADGDAAIEAAFAELARQGAGALYVGTGSFFADRAVRIAALADRYRMPAMYQFRDAVEAGGLVSYGTTLAEGFRQAGAYVGRVLKGEPPAKLPVVRSSKFELVFNAKTAKALGLRIPPALLARANAVIE